MKYRFYRQAVLKKKTGQQKTQELFFYDSHVLTSSISHTICMLYFYLSATLHVLSLFLSLLLSSL